MKPHAPQATHIPRYSALQVSATPRGRAVPILYGTGKMTSDLVWTQNFHPVAYTQNSGSGSSGKGASGGGKGGQGSTQYYYFAAMLGAICEGPIYTLVAARDGSNWVYYNGNSPKPSWPVTSSWPSASPGTFAYEGYPLAASLGALGIIAGGAMLPWEVQQYFFPGELAAYEESGMLDDNNNINPSSNKGFQQAGTTWQNIGPNSWATQAFMLINGYANNPVPPYILGTFPSQAASYQYTAYWFSPNYQLGQSPHPPTLDWWVCGLQCYDPAGTKVGVSIVDAEPISVIIDLITNPIHGAGISGQFLDTGNTLAQYQTYTVASGLFLSILLTGQIECRQIIDQIFKETVGVTWWSEGLVKAKPWYDLSISSAYPYGNKTYNPVLTPVYSVTDDQWQDQKGRGPLELQRSSVFDTYNQLSLNFTNRQLNYSTDTITVDDQANQEMWGVRPAPPASSQYIADPSVAAGSAQLQLAQLMYQRNTYNGTLPFTYCLIEPMDILLLNDLGLGVLGWPARIMQIALNQKEQYQVTLQNIVDEVYGVQARNQQAGTGSGLPGNVPPGHVETPFIFTGPVRLSPTGPTQVEIWCAVTGRQQGWGGCTVWMSTDGTSYEKVATSWGGCRYGTLFQPCNSFGGTNPDNVDSVYVQLIGPNSNLSSVSTTQAAQGLTLSLIQTGTNYELLGYQGAVLTGSNWTGNRFQLKHLYRALDGSFGIAHNYGDNFARLDGNIIKIPIDVSMIGQTVYLKFCSFNLIGGQQQGLSQAQAYSYLVLNGVDSPVGSSSLSVSNNGPYTVLTWTADNSPQVVKYIVKYGPVGGTYYTAKFLYETRANHSVTLIVPPGTWTFYVASVDKSGRLGQIQSVTASVAVQQILLDEANYGAVIHAQDPGSIEYNDWQQGYATLTNCFVHPTAYVLAVPDSTLASFSGADNGWEWVDQYCITPPTTPSSYVSPVINIGPGQTSVRASAAIYEYLWGSPPNPSASAVVVQLAPDFAPNVGTISFSGCYVHPTAWGLVPIDTLPANYSGADQGWEVFDYTVFSPPASSTMTYTLDGGVIVPEQATLITSARPSPGGYAPVVTNQINYSGDNVHWTALASSPALGTVSGSAIARYFQYVVTIQNTQGQFTKVELDPYWTNVVVSGGLIHPTTYNIVPVDTVKADYGSGFEIFDNFAVAPVASTTATYVVNTNQTGPVTGSIDSSFTAGPGQTVFPANIQQFISTSPDGSTWTLIDTGTGEGQTQATASGQYWQFQIALTNQPGNLVYIDSSLVEWNILNPVPGGGMGIVDLVTCELNGNPSSYWTTINPLMRQSPDNVNWSAWAAVPSTFTNQQYLQFMFTWQQQGAPWPFGPASAWFLLDGSPFPQNGTAVTSAGAANITFPIPYRETPELQVSVVGGGNVVASIFSVSPLGATLQTVSGATGAAVNATVSWTAMGV